MKQHKKILLWTSAVILLPMLSGLVLWDRLPPYMVSHWGPDGQPDGTAAKGFVVFGLPLLMLALHWLCSWITFRDPGNRRQDRKILRLALWIVPVLALLCGGTLQAFALGWQFSVHVIPLLLCGGLFTVIGNYLPKCTRNMTIGIKIKWTLASDGNWNATHRLAGHLWVAGGLLLMLCAFLPAAVLPWGIPALLLVMVLVPILYSWQYDQK